LRLTNAAHREPAGQRPASGLSTDEPGRIQAKTAIVAEVERLHRRIWNGKARNARLSLERIRKTMHVFKGSAVIARRVCHPASCGTRCTRSITIYVASALGSSIMPNDTVLACASKRR